jgi:hypothetical protein
MASHEFTSAGAAENHLVVAIRLNGRMARFDRSTWECWVALRQLLAAKAPQFLNALVSESKEND